LKIVYISPEAIHEIERKYGTPEEVSFRYEMTEKEFNAVLRSQKDGRAHDVTLFIVESANIVVIKKPMYPPGAYRAPSGGVEPGEDFESGALREAYEETGLSVALHRYILRSRVRFTHSDQVIDWVSHVFSANALSGTLDPIDTDEIVEARFASREDLLGSIRQALISSGSTGLRYRAALTDAVMATMMKQGLI
jgi:8-oxo-dGTP pyrophosphatase MutT (NUDIX family)